MNKQSIFEATKDIEHLYIILSVAGKKFGIGIEEVVEVIRIVEMTTPPEAPAFVVGLINLRGEVVPVVDMRMRLNFEPKKYTLDTPILIVRTKERRIGLAVDSVFEVQALPSASIESASKMLSISQCIFGVAKAQNCLIFLIDTEKVVSGKDIKFIEKINDQGRASTQAIV